MENGNRILFFSFGLVMEIHCYFHGKDSKQAARARFWGEGGWLYGKGESLGAWLCEKEILGKGARELIILFFPHLLFISWKSLFFKGYKNLGYHGAHTYLAVSSSVDSTGRMAGPKLFWMGLWCCSCVGNPDQVEGCPWDWSIVRRVWAAKWVISSFPPWKRKTRWKNDLGYR